MKNCTIKQLSNSLVIVSLLVLTCQAQSQSGAVQKTPAIQTPEQITLQKAIVDKINIASRLMKQGLFQQIVTEIESTFPPAQHVGDVKFGNLYRYLFQAYLALGDIPSAQSAAKSATFATKPTNTPDAYRKLFCYIGEYAYCDFLQMIGETQNAQLVYYDHLLSNRQWDWNKEDCLPVKVVFEEDANGEFWE